MSASGAGQKITRLSFSQSPGTFFSFELENGGRVHIPPEQVMRLWNNEQDRLRTKDPLPDKVQPSHYRAARLEAIDVIEAFDLEFCTGNVIKYVLRAGKKEGESEFEDLQKARWYLDRRLQQLQNGATGSA